MKESSEQEDVRPASGSAVDGGSGSGLTKVTANLVPRAVNALNRASDISGDNRTDVINRALQVYAYLVEAMEAEGKRIFVEGPEQGERERLILL